MTVHATQPGEHSVARPLPEPPRTHNFSRLSRLEHASDALADALTVALEEWLAEIKLRYTIGGE